MIFRQVQDFDVGRLLRECLEVIQVSHFVVREVDGFDGGDVFADDLDHGVHDVGSVERRVDGFAWEQPTKQKLMSRQKQPFLLL